MRRSFPAAGAAALIMIFHPAANGATPASAEADLLDVTCGQYMAAIKVAQPDAKATAAQKALANAAQDDLASTMLWVHGFLSGRDGVNPAARPLTKSWMADTVVKLATLCSASDAGLRLSDAATKL
ncbi:Putative secreted protein [Sphingopyxis fribergensis]|uniref:Putative secreted protein n=1 Tax=Sphingopyxis fribergensis TaxID=1515612 RepID=A0A0A7PI32_9SPHN|nr:hypothetical protein [Sphingopyxis fribergensis]AJA09761.1 Putative secreted protein [Sphingopyxis fribergensis]